LYECRGSARATARRLGVPLLTRGELTPSIFTPPSRVDAVVELDTSDQEDPDVGPIEAAVGVLLH
jgi:hypothetical protein